MAGREGNDLGGLACVNGVEYILPLAEFDILQVFAKNRGQVVGLDELNSILFSGEEIISPTQSNTRRTTLISLMDKLNLNPEDPEGRRKIIICVFDSISGGKSVAGYKMEPGTLVSFAHRGEVVLPRKIRIDRKDHTLHRSNLDTLIWELTEEGAGEGEIAARLGLGELAVKTSLTRKTTKKTSQVGPPRRSPTDQLQLEDEITKSDLARLKAIDLRKKGWEVEAISLEVGYGYKVIKQWVLEESN